MKKHNISRIYKHSKCFLFDNVDYSRVIATRTYELGFINHVKEFIRTLLFEYDIKYIDNSSDILTIYSYRGKGRHDYDYIIDEFRRIYTKNMDELECVYKFSLKIRLSTLCNFIKVYSYFIKNKIPYALMATLLTIQHLKYSEYINNILKTKSYILLVSFCDAHGVENLTTQLAKQLSIKTSTLQHGQYRLLSPANENADIEAYENFTSDYIMAWGEITRNEFVKYGIDSKRILLTGALKEFSYNECIEADRYKGVFGVILDGENYRSSNVKLLTIASMFAERTGFKFIVRLHPKNDFKTYSGNCNTKYVKKVIKGIENYDYAKEVDFSILHMTGVFVELLSINSPIMVLCDDYTEDIFKLNGATFHDCTELIKCYNELKQNRKSFLDIQYKMYRKFNQGDSLKNNYIKAINYIIDGRI